MSKNSSSSSSGIGFTGLLQILFIALKLLKIINWSWWLVLLPTFISMGVAVTVLVIWIILMIKS